MPENDTHDASIKHDVAELEMLVEAYFVQVEGTLNDLSVVRALNLTDRQHK